MTPERDAAGNIVKDRRGRAVVAVGDDGKKITDTEDVPLREDIDMFMTREVEPYNPGAWYDKKKIQEGYIIPFTSAFYQYYELEPSADIAERILNHVAILQTNLNALFGEVK